MPDSQIVHHPSRILQAFEALRASAPDAPALLDGSTGSVTSRMELSDLARSIGSILRNSGLGPGDFVAVQLRNSPQFVGLFLAALDLGITLIPLDRDARDTEIDLLASQIEIRALVLATDDESAGGITVRSIQCDRRAASVWSDRSTAARPWIPLVKLTSGSSGRPKGILTTEDNLIADCTNICRTMRIAPGDLNFGAIPFSHSYGFSSLVTPLLIQGTPIVVSNDYLPLSILDLCNRFHCTVVPGIPMMFDHLAQIPSSDGDFVSVRTFLSAGAPLPSPVSVRFRERFGHSIHSFYGCSETGGISYDREGGSVERGSVGAPLEGVSLAIDRLNGRLTVQSSAVAAGYINALAEERSRFETGSYRTDDQVDLDPSGELRLLGRLSELINVAGKKVNPREIEETILRLDGIREVKVFGIAAGARGEMVAAAVVADPHLNREAIRRHCRIHLASHKVPRVIRILDALPVDERGKIRRSELVL